MCVREQRKRGKGGGEGGRRREGEGEQTGGGEWSFCCLALLRYKQSHMRLKEAFLCYVKEEEKFGGPQSSNLVKNDPICEF